jgi:hypothetical protein
MASNMYIKQQIEINRAQKEVYDYLKYADNQNYFSIWNMADPNKTITRTGLDGTVGYISTWDSTNKNVGAGAQEITGLVEPSTIEYDIRFERPMKSVAKASFRIESTGANSCMVSWDFSSPTKFPMSLFTFIFKIMLGKNMRQSMNNLQNILEK